MTNEIYPSEPSELYLSTIEQLRVGEEPTVDALKDSLAEATFAITNFAATINNLQTDMANILSAHINNDDSALKSLLSDATDKYFISANHSSSVH